MARPLSFEAAAMQMNLVPKAGERMSIFGMTGSGKTSFFMWLAKRIVEAPLIIYDVKIEPKFETLPHSTVVETPQEILDAVETGEFDYIIARPSVHLMDDPDALDRNYLLNHYYNLQGLPAYIDEAYPFHKNARAGKGLTALMTRGRSKGITTIISSQLPKYISRFCITEVNKSVLYKLQDMTDRKRINDLIPGFSDLAPPPKFHFYGIDLSEMETPQLFKPIPLERSANTGYVDKPKPETVASAAPAPRKSQALWL